MIISNPLSATNAAQSAMLSEVAKRESTDPAAATSTVQADSSNASDTLATSQVSVETADAAIQDANEAKQALEFVRKQMLAQPGAVFSAQAGRPSQSALQLLS
jgi:flagellin-like hook-associated protein FlgL